MKYKLIETPIPTEVRASWEKLVILHRIQAMEDFEDVKAGDIGGFVESEKNLSQDGTCWVYDNAMVFGEAYVSSNAQIKENTKVFEKARVSDNARVFGNAIVRGNARVMDNAVICGMAAITQNAVIYDNAKVHGLARISKYSQVGGDAIITGMADISGHTYVNGNIFLSIGFFDKNAIITKGSDFICFDRWWDENHKYVGFPRYRNITWTRSNGLWNCIMAHCKVRRTLTEEDFIKGGREFSQIEELERRRLVNYVHDINK